MHTKQDLNLIYNLYTAVAIAMNYFDTHATNGDAPYHNKYHTECMIAHAYKASIFEQLSIADTANLLMACAFHDFNHYQGKHPDSENVLEAITQFDKFFKHVLLKYPKNIRANISLVIVTDIIKATEYPYTYKATEIKQLIIRDCDFLQFTGFDPIGHCIFGLYKEMLNGENIMPFESFYDKYAEFVNNISFKTLYGKSFDEDRMAWCLKLRDLRLDLTKLHNETQIIHG